MKKRFKSIFKLGVLALLAIIVITYASDKVVQNAATGKLYSSVAEIPHNKVGLFLGTAKYLSSGQLNLYYKYRIEAAVKLYDAGKVEFILVSGDNSRKDYDEPTTIKNDLISRGIPAERIFLDYAGFRTLDSVVRSKAIFGQEKLTVISQPFHNERAVFIASKKRINAIGFNAQDVSLGYGFKVQMREKLARNKMVLDLIFGKKPKYLGEQIVIE
ncbi:MAG: vancomycin high temperature exclusion protein [Bacteroidetes bacterium]|nr:MAG: vancomycin high temperature exclusion protein [Bacteroidota bacterium]